MCCHRYERCHAPFFSMKEATTRHWWSYLAHYQTGLITQPTTTASLVMNASKLYRVTPGPLPANYFEIKSVVFEEKVWKNFIVDNAGKLGHGGCVFFNPIALRKVKIVCNFGLSECTRAKWNHWDVTIVISWNQLSCFSKEKQNFQQQSYHCLQCLLRHFCDII